MLLCFCGMKLPPSSTIERSSSGETRASFTWPPAWVRNSRRICVTNRLTNQITGLNTAISGRSTMLVGRAIFSG